MNRTWTLRSFVWPGLALLAIMVWTIVADRLEGVSPFVFVLSAFVYLATVIWWVRVAVTPGPPALLRCLLCVLPAIIPVTQSVLAIREIDIAWNAVGAQAPATIAAPLTCLCGVVWIIASAVRQQLKA